MKKIIAVASMLITILLLNGSVSEKNDVIQKQAGKKETGVVKQVERKKSAVSKLLNNYFVDQLDSSANDNNPGSEEQPFKSINGAFKKLKLKPGDTIWVKDGVYREWVNLQSKTNNRWKNATVIPSGHNYSQMITLAAYPGDKPVVKGSDVVTGWKKYKDNIWVRDDWKINSQQMFADGKILDQIGGKMAEGHITTAWHWKHKSKTLKDIIPGSFYYDLKAKKLYVCLKDGGNPNEHLLEASTRERLIQIGDLEYIRVSGLTLRHGNNFRGSAALIVSGRHCVIEDIDQAWHAFSGGAVMGEYLTFSRCKFNHNGNNGMGGRRRGHRIIDCETNYNNYRNWSSGWHSGGVKFIPDCHDWVLKGHVAAYNNGDGIWFDEAASNVTIEGCRSYRNTHCGIHYEISSRGVIKNNILYENGHRGIYLANSSYCMVANNLCYRNGMSGIVCVNGARKGGMFGIGEKNVWPGGHNNVVGNIMVDNCWDEFRDLKKFDASWATRPELVMPKDIAVNSGCFSDYNIFYRSGKRDNAEKLKFWQHWDNGAEGLDKWREMTGWDKNSVYAKPCFKDVANYDFHPTADCPSLWFVAKPDMSVFYDCEDKLRPGWRAARTAGPYGGGEELYKKLKKSPKSGAFQMVPMPANNYVDTFFFQVVALSRQLPDHLGSKMVTKLAKGIELDGIPYLLHKTGVVLCAAKPEKVVKPKITVQKLHFLITALDYSDKPFAECVMSRNDGVKIKLLWRGDGKGGITTESTKNLNTQELWSGKVKHWDLEQKKFAHQTFKLFVTTWTNDNEWLPIEKCEFKLLDDKAKVAVLAVTGNNDK